MDLIELLINPNKYNIEIEDYLETIVYDGYSYFTTNKYTPDTRNTLIWVCKATFKFNIQDIIKEYGEKGGNFAYKNTNEKENKIYYKNLFRIEEICIEYIKDKNIYILYFHHKTPLYQKYSKLYKI